MGWYEKKKKKKWAGEEGWNEKWEEVGLVCVVMMKRLGYGGRMSFVVVAVAVVAACEDEGEDDDDDSAEKNSAIGAYSNT